MVDAMKSYMKTTLWAGLVSMSLLAGTAQAQSNDASNLVNRLDRIENELLTLNKEVYRGTRPPAVSGSQGAVPSNFAASFEVRLGQVEAEMQNLTGTIEQNQRALIEIKNMLSRMQSDYEHRFSIVEQGQAPSQYQAPISNQAYRQQAAPAPVVQQQSGRQLEAPAIAPVATQQAPRQLFTKGSQSSSMELTATGAAPASAAGTLGVVRKPADVESYQLPENPVTSMTGVAPSVDDVAKQSGQFAGPDAHYDFAYGELRRGDFQSAQSAFEEFKIRYPEHRLVSNAQYWLAETYYATGDFSKAALLFSEGYQNFPDSGKAADSLLKLSMSLYAMGRKEDGCIALQSLYAQFSNMAPQTRRIADREKAKMGC